MKRLLFAVVVGTVLVGCGQTSSSPTSPSSIVPSASSETEGGVTSYNREPSAHAASSADLLADSGSCSRDSKLIGPVSVFGDENEVSWWNLIYNGMLAAGLTSETEQRDYLNGVFGTGYLTLADVRDYNLQAVSDTFDKNGNGSVCAYELRGTRAYNTDPYADYTLFGISDDKIKKN